MSFITWKEVPIATEGFRSTDLEGLTFDRSGGLILRLHEDGAENLWSLSFDCVQGFRITTEECSAGITEMLPMGGGFFKSTDSDWLKGLGKGDTHFLDTSCHFVICCYDEVIEVAAGCESPLFKKIG